MNDVARVILLLLFSAFFLALIRGDARRWLRAKFLGRVPAVAR